MFFFVGFHVCVVRGMNQPSQPATTFFRIHMVKSKKGKAKGSSKKAKIKGGGLVRRNVILGGGSVR